eukprot:CAMPEP_0181380196 /NCGR_PEP_ID=MMETSP1106-20121128/19413_1 /TAXON_ID=81844 /ORGANISM="Mantoniella antarctica, Strain SL-175" /LENGTH=132 /DNA_ID=CAMNT_0023499205 /DNA_START=123 /DNA_END=517 /DNA_ORIENTATION=+
MNEDFFFLNLFENKLSPRFIDRLTAAILDPPVLDVFPAVSFALHAPLAPATNADSSGGGAAPAPAPRSPGRFLAAVPAVFPSRRSLALFIMFSDTLFSLWGRTLVALERLWSKSSPKRSAPNMLPAASLPPS